MAQESLPETQVSSTISSSSSDPSLSKSLSFSRLNAKAPEFVPNTTRATALPRIIVAPQAPPPLSGGIVYHPTPTFVPIHHYPNQLHQQQQQQQQRNHHQQHQQHLVQYHQHHQYYNNGGGGGFVAQKEVVVPVRQQVAQVDAVDHGVASRNDFSDESNEKVLNQVEYYFSDLNLATTDHLVKFINKDPEGYVPLSVVLSFKKIKALVSGYFQLATILRNSTKLVVSKDGKKVKRKHPLTRMDLEEMQTRIVVAENLPEDHCHQNLVKVFSTVGSVKTIRTCQPQPTNAGASSGSKSGKVDEMLFCNKLHAFVEYESVELAEKAVTELNNVANWRSGLKVRLLLRRTSKPGLTQSKKGHEYEGNGVEEDISASDLQLNEKQSGEVPQQCDVQLHDQTGESDVNDKDAGQMKGRNRGRGKGQGRGQNQGKNRGNHMASPAMNNLIGKDISASKQLPGPRMPDGTRGFAMGRGKPASANVVAS